MHLNLYARAMGLKKGALEFTLVEVNIINHNAKIVQYFEQSLIAKGLYPHDQLPKKGKCCYFQN